MITYYKLLDLLERRSLTRHDLQVSAEISSSTMAKLSKNKVVSLEVIDKICCALDCQPGDIIEYVPADRMR